MKTFGSRLTEFRGIGPGFDFLRVALAISIMLDHSFLIVNGNYNFIDTNNLWTVFANPLPMFFALSGFLICGSAQRLKLKDFLLNRAIRIVPALGVDILISALLIGPVFTIFSFGDYLRGKEFHRYFLNLIGFIHFELPGVFSSNPFPMQVNGSLWTVPFEIGCYIVMSLLILTSAVKHKGRLLIAFALFVLIFYIALIAADSSVDMISSDNAINHYASNFIGSRGRYLYFYFLSGVLLFTFKDYIPFSIGLAVISAVLLFFGHSTYLDFGNYTPLVLFLPTGYLTVYLGLKKIPRLPIYSRGDYSYGIYLYAYPLQQVLIVILSPKIGVPLHFLLSLLLSTCVAIASWHGVEKPILQLRKKFSFTARKGDEVQNLPKPIIL